MCQAIVFGLAGSVFTYLAFKPSTRRTRQARRAQVEAANAADRALWQRAQMLWPQLYYCAGHVPARHEDDLQERIDTQ
jgi:hypothetical protein